MDLGELTSVFAYMMAFALLESLAVSILITLPTIFLPQKWYKDGFVYKAAIVLFVALVVSIRYQEALTTKYLGDSILIQWVFFTGLAVISLIFIAHKWIAFQKMMVFLVEQISVMLFVYIPLGIFSLLITMIRLIN